MRESNTWLDICTKAGVRPAAVAITVLGTAVSMVPIGAHYFGKLEAKLDSHDKALVLINETLKELRTDMSSIKEQVTEINHNAEKRELRHQQQVQRQLTDFALSIGEKPVKQVND